MGLHLLHAHGSTFYQHCTSLFHGQVCPDCREFFADVEAALAEGTSADRNPAVEFPPISDEAAAEALAADEAAPAAKEEADRLAIEASEKATVDLAAEALANGTLAPEAAPKPAKAPKAPKQ